jgi:hypothetical protein
MRVTGAGPTVDKGPGISRVLQNLVDPIERRRPPHHLSKPVTPRHAEVPAGEGPHHLADRALLQEAGEDQGDAVLDLAVGILDHRSVGGACQPGRQVQRQLAAFGLAQQAGGQAAAHRV